MRRPDENLQLLDREVWLAARLAHHHQDAGMSVFRGSTTIAQRMQRFRALIASVGSSTVAAVKDKNPITYSQLFELVYRQPL
jgi:spore coat polysaccharide biosynthesis protein SpsF (cytidylyltransferase family)